MELTGKNLYEMYCEVSGGGMKWIHLSDSYKHSWDLFAQTLEARLCRK